MIIIRPQHCAARIQGHPLHHPCKAAAVLREQKKDETQKKESESNANNHNDTSVSKSGRVLMEKAPVHHKETPENATIALDVAGYSPNEIQVRLENSILYVDAQRENRLGDTYMIRRRFRLDKSTCDEERVSSNLYDGILEIVVPKKPQVGPRTIPISTSPGEAPATTVEKFAAEEAIQEPAAHDVNTAATDVTVTEDEGDINHSTKASVGEGVTNKPVVEETDDPSWEEVTK